MKKITVLLALIICVTVGSVYAAWTYTNPAADITDQLHKTLITIDAATEEGAAGTYAIDTNITAISIDQAGANSNGDDFHKAMLNYTTSDGQAPYVKFTLTLKNNTGSDIFNTLTSTYKIGIEDVAGQYNGQDIFIDKIAGEKVIEWAPGEEVDTYVCTVELDDEIALNDFVLASKGEHTAFTAALGNPVLAVKISDGIVPSEVPAE